MGKATGKFRRESEGESRRRFLSALAGGIASLGVAGLACAQRNAGRQVPQQPGSPAPAGRQGKPNFVLILADDLGYGDLSCYGAPDINTPVLDRLAAQGARFTQFYVSAPVCSPTRAGFLTGRYQQRCGITAVLTTKNRAAGMPLEEITIAEALKPAGYVTGIFGKWHLGYQPKFNPTNQGFDKFRGFLAGNIDYFAHIDNQGKHDWWDGTTEVHEEGYLTELITKHAVEFIEENKDRPFFLYVPHGCVHSPYQGPKDQATAGKRPGFRGRKVYAEMVEAMDAGVGEIVDTLQRLGLERNTLLIFFSDNGGTRNAGRNAPLSGSKATLLEGGIRVPMIAYWPGTIAPGQTVDEVTICLDFFPTLLEAAGLAPPRKLDGASLLGLFKEGRKLGERTLFWGFRNERAVRQGDWKLLIRQGQTRLFNLAEDIAEKNDLAQREPKRAAALREALLQWEKDVGPTR